MQEVVYNIAQILENIGEEELKFPANLLQVFLFWFFCFEVRIR